VTWTVVFFILSFVFFCGWMWTLSRNQDLRWSNQALLKRNRELDEEVVISKFERVKLGDKSLITYVRKPEESEMV
jgi:hypothetical protein